MFKIAIPGRLAIFLLVFPFCSFGQSYPSRPVRLILPVEPGASTSDILARALADRLGKELGQRILVDNRPGAHGNIGSAMAARAAPDGYTLLAGYSGSLAINPSMYPQMGYDPDRDLAPIARFSTVPYVLVVNPSLPANDVKELIALAKAHPGKLNYGSAGVGGTPHLAAELLKLSANIDVAHIPYNGGAKSIIDLVAGNVQMSVTGITGVLSFIKAGKLRALAVTTAARSTLLPDMPTAIEAGVKDFDVSAWLGIVAPAQVPEPVIDRIWNEISKVANSQEMKDFLKAQGAEAALMRPAEFRAFIVSDRNRWARVIKAANIQGE